MYFTCHFFIKDSEVACKYKVKEVAVIHIVTVIFLWAEDRSMS